MKTTTPERIDKTLIDIAFEQYAKQHGIHEAMRELAASLLSFVQTINSEESTIEFESEGIVTIRNFKATDTEGSKRVEV